MTDVITKYDQDCGDSGTKTKSDLLARAYVNPNIKGVVLFQDSGGGEAYAGLKMESAIHRIKATGDKPIVAFVDNLSASASYMMGSAADFHPGPGRQ